MSDKEKLQGLLDELEIIIKETCPSTSKRFQKWYYKTDRFIKRYFGNSEEYNRWGEYYGKIINGYSFQTREMTAALTNIQSDLEVYLEEMEEEPDYHMTEKKCGRQEVEFDNSKVFIVHGHDENLRLKVEILLKDHGIEPIILKDSVNKGLTTLIEKIEKYSGAGAAVCLFTADDTGKAKKESDLHDRARQNVVFETGYFLGLLKRQRVIVISDESIELPSDLRGVVTLNSGDFEINLLRELSSIGYAIDGSKILE